MYGMASRGLQQHASTWKVAVCLVAWEMACKVACRVAAYLVAWLMGLHTGDGLSAVLVRADSVLKLSWTVCISAASICAAMTPSRLGLVSDL